jgi:hypothetical protein
VVEARAKGFLTSAHPFNEVEATYYYYSNCDVRKQDGALKTGYFVLRARREKAPN